MGVQPDLAVAPEEALGAAPCGLALGALRLRFAEAGGRTTLTLEPADGTKITLGRDSALPS